MASFTAAHGILRPSTRFHALLPSCFRILCFSLLLLLSKPTFAAASQTTPATTPALKSSADTNNPHRIFIVSTASALLLAGLLLMAYFSCFRFRIGKKISHQEEGGELEECDSEKTHVSDRTDSVREAQPKCVAAKKDFSSVWRFGWDEIELLSKNFSSVIGEGGFSTVYLGVFSDSSFSALKIHRNSEWLSQVFKQELDVLMQLHHENIVKLIGYCDEREEGVLVFEYVTNGSLYDKLHGQGNASQVLPWKHRMSIAFQLARGIEYLHDRCSLQIIHSDIKASNVLLDDQFNCKLCDFGCAKMGFSSTVLPSSRSTMMGSPGYVDPHYIRTGIISKKNDVYSFGVLVLELITGIEAFCSEKEQLLTALASPVLRDATKVTDMIDPQLAGEFDVEEAVALASVAALCLQAQPTLRPSMTEILRIMREKISSVALLSRDCN
ncbi:hypothetical protein ACLOJK_032180 [Asimina triloba]